MFCFQSVKSDICSDPINVQYKELEEYYMTDPISRASKIMAQCVQAVRQQKESKYYDPEAA